MAEAERLQDLGEWQLIERLGRFAPPGQFRDDAALVAAPGRLVVNTDVLVDGVHFSERTTSPHDVGWRAAAANLSDLAAMGCSRSLGLTVGLVAPPSTCWSWVEGVYQGLAACLRSHGHGGVLLGGDCSSGSQRLLAITALGPLDPAEGAIRRCDGRPGDWLVTSGPHGLSRLGLALLQHELSAVETQGLPDALRRRAITAHQRPVPRFDAVRALHASRPDTSAWRVGGTDSSDGLAAAAAAIAATSGCQALLERSRLPLEPGMAPLGQAESWCLAGGEDFELLLALEPRWAERWLEALPGSQAIGVLAEAPAGSAHEAVAWAVEGLQRGSPLPLGLGGFSHFQRQDPSPLEPET
jgi:thiamine-monophosphate kinase